MLYVSFNDDDVIKSSTNSNSLRMKNDVISCLNILLEIMIMSVDDAKYL